MLERSNYRIFELFLSSFPSHICRREDSERHSSTVRILFVRALAVAMGLRPALEKYSIKTNQPCFAKIYKSLKNFKDVEEMYVLSLLWNMMRRPRRRNEYETLMFYNCLLFIFVMPKFVQTFYHIFFQFFSLVFFNPLPNGHGTYAMEIPIVLSWLRSNS